MNSWLIFRGGAVGDFIVTLPALRSIRSVFPDSRITLVTYPRVFRLALESGLADDVESLDGSETGLLYSSGLPASGRLAALVGNHEHVVSFLRDPDGAVKRNLLEAGAGRLLCVDPLVENEHAVDHFLQPLKSEGISAGEGVAPRLCLSEQRIEEGKHILNSFGSRVCLFHPGSGSSRKNWSLRNFTATAARLEKKVGVRCVFTFGEADSLCKEEFIREGAGFPCMENVELATLASMLVSCAAYAGNDSGITHLAGAAGAPAVALFGPTEPEIWGPRNGNVHIIRSPAEANGDIDGISADEVAEMLIRIVR